MLLFWVILGCKSEICQLDIDLFVVDIVGVLLAEQILWFQVTVHDVLLVHEVESKEDLLDHMSRLRLSELLQASNLCKQITASNDLHDDVVVSLVFQKLIDSSDVGVLDGLQNLELVLVQLLVHLRLIQLSLLDGFDGAGHVSLPVTAEMHGAESTLSNLLALGVESSKSFDCLKLHGALEADQLL